MKDYCLIQRYVTEARIKVRAAGEAEAILAAEGDLRSVPFVRDQLVRYAAPVGPVLVVDDTFKTALELL